MINKLRQALANGLLGEFIRYTIVGIVAFAVDYGTLLALNKLLHVNYLLAAVVGFVLGTICNYAGSTRYVFKSRAVKDKRLEWVAFVVIGLMGLLLNELFLYLFTGRLGIPVQYSKPLTQMAVFLWNFGARKAFLFSEKRKQAAN